MAKGHDQAARRIAEKLRGKYDPTSSPDVKSPKVRVEVKSTPKEIPEALHQLAGGQGLAYVALPKKYLREAQERLQGRKTGLMDWEGNVIKASTRGKGRTER